MEFPQELVEELYNFRDYYFENHSIDLAANFHADVKNKMISTLDKLEAAKCNTPNFDRAYYFYLVGKTYNVEGEYNAKAEENLSKAVKLNPSLIDGWNHLGDTYFKKGNYYEAKNCFANALNKEKNKVSLRNLSVVSRKESASTKESMINNVSMGVRYATEALELDPNDGTSWYIMGNAFISSFFSIKQSGKTLMKAMDAYNRAEDDKVARNNPDLYYNKAVALKFQEEYESALICFDKAHSFDPNWETPQILRDNLLKYLNSIQDLINSKGRVKNKKLHALVKSINVEKHLAPFDKLSEDKNDKKLTYIPLSQLMMGLNEDKVILGTVVCSVQNEELVPFTFCMVDTNYECIAVTVYNLANGQGVIIGDIVAIAIPFLRSVDFRFKNMKFNFKSIRISNPLLMAVNGKLLSSSKMSSMQISTFSEADNKI
ncbi:hypothetical protein V9T40_008357 [Parthenolecanium corni]|uniref:Cell division cycle protein 27 homolog n=1 Tax=Parthenolecanium corni TaxID=536013 RepID=A0AAN9TQ90_9HEMI